MRGGGSAAYWMLAVGSGAHVLVNELLDVTRELAQANVLTLQWTPAFVVYVMVIVLSVGLIVALPPVDVEDIGWDFSSAPTI